MRDLFRGYYKPTDGEISGIWQEGIFTFDANMLLNVYQYSPKTQDSFFKILEKLSSRIWVPHQAAYEYQERRLEVISEQHRAYKAVVRILDTNFQAIEKAVKAYEKHTLIDISQIKTVLKESIDRVKGDIQKAAREHPKLHKSDNLRETIDRLFSGKVGQPYSEDELEKIYDKAEQRYKWQVPPGYMDSDKNSPYSKKFGDVILWFQLIDHARSEKNPIIFITDDTKEDWWLQHEGNVVGPRPELIQEMLTKAGVQFHMYEGYAFIECAERFLHLEHQQEVIDEIKEVGRQEKEIGNRHACRNAYRKFIQETELQLEQTRTDPRLSKQSIDLARYLLDQARADPRLSKQSTDLARYLLDQARADPRLLKQSSEQAQDLLKLLTASSQNEADDSKFACERCGKPMSSEEYDDLLICSDCWDDVTSERDE